MDIQILGIAIGVIATIWGIGWKISNCMNDIRITVARIEALLQATSQRLDRIEVEVKDIDNRLRKQETK
jgi:hypothetical protein